MILNDITVITPKKQVRKVFEQFFASDIAVEKMNKWQTRRLLGKIRGVLAEHRASPRFHNSEHDSGYLKMVMMEQALTDHLRSGAVPEVRHLVENDVQQAQVVLAAKDMVDSVQKMIEDLSEMQFKELPALVDSIRNQVGTAEADQFNQTVSAALSGMVQSLQGSKQQLEQAQGALTGQEMPLPGDANMPAAGPAMPGEEEIDLSLDANLPAEEEPEPEAGAELGRARR